MPKSRRTAPTPTRSFSRGEQAKINGNRFKTRGFSWISHLPPILKNIYEDPSTLLVYGPSWEKQRKGKKLWESKHLPKGD